MGVLRIIGRIFIVLGVLSLGFGGWMWFAGYDLTIAAGHIWFNVDSPSLNTTQAVIQRYLHPGIWDHGFVPLLLRPAWQGIALLVIGNFVAGGVLLFLGRRRGRRGFRS